MATLDHIYGAHILENELSDDEEALAGDAPAAPGSPSKSMISGCLTDVEEEEQIPEDNSSDVAEDEVTVIPGTVPEDPDAAADEEEDDKDGVQQQDQHTVQPARPSGQPCCSCLLQY